MKRICGPGGALRIQQLALPTLDGLENLELVAGSMVIQQNNWGSDDGNTYLNSLGALSNLRYIGGALAIQQNYHLESLDGLDRAEVGGALDIETYPNCASDCGRSLLGDSFACLSSCQPVRTTTTCPATDEQCVSRKPMPKPTPAGPRPTGTSGGHCCFWSATGNPCECDESHIAPPDNWCAPSEERCTSCQGAGNWCQ